MTEQSNFYKGAPPRALRTWWWRWHPARERLQRNPLARLNSLEEVSIAAALGIRIDVNQATVDDWLRLPGISIHQARTLALLSQQGVAFYGLEDIAAALGLAGDRLAPFQDILQFCYYDSASTVTPVAISINQATIAQLMTLPGISSAVVERIMNERRRSPFTTWADIQQRLRLTGEQVNQWLHYLKI